MKTKMLFIAILFVLAALMLFSRFWVSTQPIGIVNDSQIKNPQPLPGKNQAIINYIEANGEKIAPTYYPTVCTEFVIDVIAHQVHLSKDDKRTIRIITDKNIDELVNADSSLIKGVQIALARSGKGSSINDVGEVKPGDFVQFWNMYYGKAYGHCGVVMELEPGESLTLYSSHPSTDGYGKQKFSWPDKVYFVRLK